MEELDTKQFTIQILNRSYYNAKKEKIQHEKNGREMTGSQWDGFQEYFVPSLKPLVVFHTAINCYLFSLCPDFSIIPKLYPNFSSNFNPKSLYLAHCHGLLTGLPFSTSYPSTIFSSHKSRVISTLLIKIPQGLLVKFRKKLLNPGHMMPQVHFQYFVLFCLPEDGLICHKIKRLKCG